MGHLRTEPVPEDFDLIRAQKSLQEIFIDKEGYDYPPHVAAQTEVHMLSSFRFNEEAIQSEFEEIRDRLPWKAWKTNHRLRANGNVLHGPAEMDEDMRFEIKFELVDILHFLANMMITAGFESWDEVERWYYAKNKENFRRQAEGY